MGLKITCIKKDGGNHSNPYVAITSLTWQNDSTYMTGTYTRLEMYDFVNGGGFAYVLDSLGNKAYLICDTSPAGTKFVKTKADHVTSDNLLKVRGC